MFFYTITAAQYNAASEMCRSIQEQLEDQEREKRPVMDAMLEAHCFLEEMAEDHPLIWGTVGSVFEMVESVPFAPSIGSIRESMGIVEIAGSYATQHWMDGLIATGRTPLEREAYAVVLPSMMQKTSRAAFLMGGMTAGARGVLGRAARITRPGVLVAEPHFVVPTSETFIAELQSLTYQGGRYSISWAHMSTPLVNPQKLLRGTHANAGNVPLEVAKMMEGKVFNSFKKFRKEFWRSMSQSKYAKEFGEQNVIRMRDGLAPFAPNTQRLGGQKTYQLHHKTPIHQGGATYDLSNLSITAPKFHQEVLSCLFHYGGK